ncbi:MAG: ion transporter, partial [Balneola sp.]
MLSIVVSVIVVGLDSVADLRLEYGMPFIKWEWFFTILFTIEYALRIISVQRASGYIFSYYGLVDFFSILPTYLSRSQYFLVI